MKWSDVDWTTTEAVVRRIQERIFRAAKAGDGAQVANLQKLLARSRSAKLLAIRQVTQRNAGRNTPGIDGVVCRTPEDRVALLENGLDLKGYKPQPVRRIYIPKANGKMRPLGIPTVRDRVMPHQSPHFFFVGLGAESAGFVEVSAQSGLEHRGGQGG
jgi:RNA-directed DNA polymerase